MPMKVLVVHEPTAAGSAALERAVDEVATHGGEIHLVGFLPPPSSERSASGSNRDTRSAEDVEAAATELRARGLDCHGHAPQGFSRSSQATLYVAEKQGVDLIVLGMRRRSRVGKLVMGSDVQDVLLGAGCPVLAVKAPQDD